MKKTQRIGVYGFCTYQGSIIAIQKKRGPFKGKLDLPGGKIEHREDHIKALKRELSEELGLTKKDFEIGNILGVWEDHSRHIWEGQEHDEHIIALVYGVKVFDINLDFKEEKGDSEKIFLIQKSDTTHPKTNIFQQVLDFYNSNI
ncbi:hypothetical protein CSB09_02190 [Candidatus Gracilibacteria bacterium]|nr:MAG: hypothetical protein CSB09_02190 [Candidatus Gracilibacteria bacterium]